jgi:ATP-binding cassette subfamily C (CFTR/MRP) protein 1
LNLIVYIILVPLLRLDHNRSIRPSSAILTYLLFSTLLDLPQLRTLFLRGETLVIAIVFVITIAAKTGLLLLSTQGKKGFLRPEIRNAPPEATSSILSRSFLWWLNDLFLLGSKGSLSSTTLFALDDELRSALLGKEMSNAWDHRGIFISHWIFYLSGTDGA